MARIPFIPLDTSEPKPLIDAVRARRGGTLLELDRLLLHSPALTHGWNVYLKTIRTEMVVDPKLRELAICAVAVLNAADYEFDSHLPYFIQAGGTQAQAERLRDLPATLVDEVHFDATERAVLMLTQEMTRNVRVQEQTFAQVARALDSTQWVVELIAVIATYNMVSRFLIALELHSDPNTSHA